MEALIVFSQQTIRRGEQGHCRQNTTAPLGNERHVFPFTNRQKCHHISERLTWGSVWRRELLNSPFWLADGSAHGSLFPCHSWWFAFKVVIQMEWKKKRLPLAISGPEILLGLLTSCSFQRLLQMDGTPCLSHLLFILSGILLERDDNCFPWKKKIPPGAWVWWLSEWLALDQQIPFSTIHQLSESCF